MTTYDNWDAQTTELQNKHGYKGVSQGALAKVSIYEFVNDWLRPEISWQIFSYMRDPHKSGVWLSQRKRRIYTTTKKVIDGTIVSTKKKWRWGEGGTKGTPYSRLPLYTQISLYRSNYNDGGGEYNWARGVAPHIAYWALPANYTDGSGHGDSAYLVGHQRQRLQHTNKLLQELWVASFHRNSHYLTTKEDLQELCKINKVKGRTKLFKQKKPYPVERSHRQPIITALIKLE